MKAVGGSVDGDTLKVQLKGDKAEATIDYQFRPDGLTITPVLAGRNGYGEFRFFASDHLLGIELLNDKSVTTGGDSTHFVEHGQIRGVPAVSSARNQMVRFHFPGFGLHAYVQAWGTAVQLRVGRHDYRPLLGAAAPASRQTIPDHLHHPVERRQGGLAGRAVRAYQRQGLLALLPRRALPLDHRSGRKETTNTSWTPAFARWTWRGR